MVYFIASETKIKIGVAKNPKSRIKNLSTGNGEILKLVATVENEDRKSDLEMERQLHNQFKIYNCNLEWFNPSKELIGCINSISKDKYVEVDNGKICVYNKMSKA